MIGAGASAAKALTGNGLKTVIVEKNQALEI
jgi:flavin-dependent dehydrogenase